MLGLEGYSVKSAFFRDSARTVVEVVWEHLDAEEKDQVEYINAAIDSSGTAAGASPEWTNLLKYIDIATLHKNTGNYILDQQKAFEVQVEAIAKKKGMVFTSDKTHPIVETLFKTESTKEDLFLYKLQLFELSQIKASTDRATKALLRKSNSMIEITKNAIKLIEDQNETQED
tara:strand:+ start:1440 stop:1958 length:519 start_codon:yes stop_codon:yes gene_type:complete